MTLLFLFVWTGSSKLLYSSYVARIQQKCDSGRLMCTKQSVFSDFALGPFLSRAVSNKRAGFNLYSNLIRYGYISVSVWTIVSPTHCLRNATFNENESPRFLNNLEAFSKFLSLNTFCIIISQNPRLSISLLFIHPQVLARLRHSSSDRISI